MGGVRQSCSIRVAPATMSARRLSEMRSAIVARVRDRNPMGIADDLGHRFWRLLPCGRPVMSYPFLKRPFPRFTPQDVFI
jgi:hypothetical protein